MDIKCMEAVAIGSRRKVMDNMANMAMMAILVLGGLLRMSRHWRLRVPSELSNAVMRLHVGLFLPSTCKIAFFAIGTNVP